MESFGSFKELYDVSLKATYSMKVGNRSIEPGETLARFTRIQIAGLSELKDYVTAHGGYHDRPRVFWETTKEIDIAFSQGVFSKEQLALFLNARLLQVQPSQSIHVTQNEKLETDENCQVTLKHLPCKDLFIYNFNTGARITDFTREGQTLTFDTPFMEILVDYIYDYDNQGQIINLGSRLLNGFVSLEGKTRVKDDITGQTVTGIIYIPKLKLMSDVSIMLGTQANPVVAHFKGKGIPVGPRGTEHVMELAFLNNDIDSDM